MRDVKPENGIGGELKWRDFCFPRRPTDLRVTINDKNSRVAFVFWNWAAQLPGDQRYEKRVRQAISVVARRSGESPDNFDPNGFNFNEVSAESDEAVFDERWLVLSRVRALCEELQPGDNRVVEYARRITDVSTVKGIFVEADANWWPQLRSMTYQSELLAILAAAALESGLNADAVGLSRRNDIEPRLASDSAFLEDSMRRALARTLLDIATRTSPHRLDAQTMLQRLSPEFGNEIVEFLRSSVRWAPICHVLDRSLRMRYPTARVVAADRCDGEISQGINNNVESGSADRGRRIRSGEIFKLTAAYLLGNAEEYDELTIVRRLRERMPRYSSGLRLLRRLGISALERESPETSIATSTLQMMHRISLDSSLPIRGRRFSLWAAAELELNIRQRCGLETFVPPLPGLSDFETPTEFEDILFVLHGYNGGYHNWLNGQTSTFCDFFMIETRNQADNLIWPVSADVARRLREVFAIGADGVRGQTEPRNMLFRGAWQAVPRRGVASARELLLQSLLHPGLVRVKAAIDCLDSCGPEMRSAASEVLVDLIHLELRNRVLPAHMLEAAFNFLGTLGDPASLDVLTVASSFDGLRGDHAISLRSAALVNAGHVLNRARAHGSRLIGQDVSAEKVIVEALSDQEPEIRQAALLAAAPLRLFQVAPAIRKIAQARDGARSELATWCLSTWQDFEQFRHATT